MGFGDGMDRRDFIRFICVLGMAVLAPHSARAKEIRKLLDNYDKDGFYVRFIKPIEPIDASKWRLRVGGLCDKPGSLTLDDLKKLRKASQTSRMKCVESWSSKAKWTGFTPETLFDAVRPKKEARFLYFHAADDYYEYIPLEELRKPRVLLVYEMNDRPLPDEHGAPLRLIMPAKYGYKSVKTILALEFVAKDDLGYWEHFGYSQEGTIQPGEDFALDLNEHRTMRTPGEQDY
jgi:DMSO/TMAO reductase YedYZ molybdopterin-dependent catalytic subunit